MAELSDADIQRLAAAVARAMAPREIPDETISAIAMAAARTAVQESNVKAFALLGYNIAKDDDMKRLRANMDFIDRLREGSAKFTNAAIKTVATAIVLAILAWIAIGAKVSLNGGPPAIK